MRLIGKPYPGGGFATDGSRYAAFFKEPGVLRVYDSARRSFRDTAVPCSSVSAGAAGHFPLACDPAAPSPFRLFDARRGALELVPGEKPSDRFSRGFGRHWIAGYADADTPGEDRPPLLYLNWRTGARVEIREDAEPSEPVDLDYPTFARYTNIPFSRYYVFGRGNGISLVTPHDPPQQGRVTLVRNGKAQTIGRRNCEADCLVAPFGSSRAAWTEWAPKGIDVFGYLVDARRRLRWRVSDLPEDFQQPLDLVHARHTRYEILINVVRRTRSEGPKTVYPDAYSLYAARFK